MQIKSAKDLIVYQKAYALAMEIFAVGKRSPAEEKYSLIDQIRRSSRSVYTNLRKAWAKRRYEAHFVSKLTDADGESGETETGLISPMTATICRNAIMRSSLKSAMKLEQRSESMINDPSSFILR